MNNTRDNAFINEIDRLSYDFLDFTNEYNNNLKNDVDMLDYVTQPFWQSMFLSKKRLDKNDITVDSKCTIEEGAEGTNNIPEIDKVTNLGAVQGIDTETDGINNSGFLLRKVDDLKTYKKHNKIIYKKKEKELMKMSVIKSRINNDEVACINCGYVDKISSFIDGCDACNTKYTVNDFAAKVAGLSFEENTNYKIKKAFSGAFKIVLSVIIMMALVGGVLVLFNFNKGNVIYYNNQMIKDNEYLNIGFILLILSGSFIFLSLYSSIYLIVIRMIFQKKYGNMYTGEEIVKNIFENFSIYDFSQKMDYKLKNLHYAEETKELESYFKVPIEHFIKKYSDVIECSLVSIKFIDAKEKDNGYEISVNARLKLVKCHGNRIKITYENVNFIAYGKRGVVDRKVKALRLYKCPTCSGSLNILEGSKCSYCNNEYDYSDFDWIIKEYKVNRKKTDIYTRIRIVVPIVYVFNYLTIIGQYTYMFISMFFRK